MGSNGKTGKDILPGSVRGLGNNSHVCESQVACRKGLRGHCSDSFLSRKVSFSKLGPTQPVVKDDAQIAVLGEWECNRKEARSPRSTDYREKSQSYFCISSPQCH